MRRFLTELKPSCFEDVIAAISLFRPGTLDAGMVDPFIHRKHGKEPVEYDHPLLEPVLRDTYGVIIYQEQVMRAAQALARATRSKQADILRAAMGKKQIAVMEKEREHFISGAVKNGVDTALAESIFEKIATFASYGFNRSHAAAYALTSYTTAYLKAHFPHEFMAALMSLDMDDTGKTYKNIAALREMRIRILPPDVNQSRVKFTVTDGAIRFGLGAIRGVGVKSAEEIIAVREKGGSIQEPCRFLPARRHSTAQPPRARSVDQMRRVRFRRDRARRPDRANRRRPQTRATCRERRRQEPDGPVRQEQRTTRVDACAIRFAEWPQKELLKYEKEALGFYITAHPLDKYDRELRRIGKLTTADLPSAPDGSKVSSPASSRRSSSRTTSRASATRPSRWKIATARSNVSCGPRPTRNTKR